MRALIGAQLTRSAMAKRSRKKSSAIEPTDRKSTPVPARARASALPTWFGSDWFSGVTLVLAIVIIYLPVWQAAYVWDDASHITRPELRSLHGLWRIWFDLSATQQYYPVVHSVFWFEHRLWGDEPLGYHLVNVALLAASALLLVKILRRLEIPGAWLAAAIFALHPVQVESVAWITELKNMLSGLLCFSAALAYLNFDRTRNPRFYWAALIPFFVGLLCKSVIATMPAALLVIFWWQRGKLNWKKDILPLAPFFVVGIGSGLFTAWVEKTYIGAEGSEFDLSFIDRGLIAGHVVWFYIYKLVWPAPLIFIYPHWTIDSADWTQYLFPISAFAAVAILFWLRTKWRGPLAGFLFFVGTLFPVLGFLNVYPFRFSFVADHFQYLACLGIIVPVAAGLTLLCRRWLPNPPWLRAVLATGLLLPLSVLSWQRTWAFQNEQTLWDDTLAKNPNCWMADNNLGLLLFNHGQTGPANDLFNKALALSPNYDDAHYNLGVLYYRLGRHDQALAEYRRTAEINPKYAQAYGNMGIVLAEQGKLDEAVDDLSKVVQLRPTDAQGQNNLGFAYFKQGRVDEAIARYRKSLAIDPTFPNAHSNLGIALAQKGQLDEAIAELEESLRTYPANAQVHDNLGNAYAQKGRWDDAIAQFQACLAIAPDYFPAQRNLGVALLQRGDAADAVTALLRAQGENPSDAATQKYLAEAQARAKSPPVNPPQ